ncbi:MAG: phenylacetate--CoA ligase family protein, partial [Dokdonella sp.]|nr:phenylacetate--CoA ligase family protein [Dokdonella sp.]
HAAFNRHMLNAFLMSADNLPEYAAAIERSRPEIIVGYVGPLVRLAEWLRAQGRKPHRPHAVLGAAEALHAPQRALLEEVFGAPVYDTYGCREFMLIASECAHREGLHTTADHLHVELANLQARHAGGESGDVIVTDLHNFGMPLLRYANGDMATPSRRTCACGRGLPLLERIDGRRLDTLRTPAGHLLPGEYIVYAFLDVLSVKRYQVVQRESDALDIRLVPGDGFGEATLEQIRRLLENVIGESMKLRFHVVDDIPASASGKYRVAICELR